MSTYNQQGAYPDPSQGQGGYGQPAPYGQGFGPNPTEKNNLGNWALGLGIASLLCCGLFTGIPAAITGYLGIQAANQGRATNKGMAIAGIVMAGLSIVWTIVMFMSGGLGILTDN